jgi:hypothetical protein
VRTWHVLVEHRQRTTDSAGPESTIDSQLPMARVPWPSSEKKKAQSTSDSRPVTVSRRVQRILWLPGYEANLTLGTLIQALGYGTPLPSVSAFQRGKPCSACRCKCTPIIHLIIHTQTREKIEASHGSISESGNRSALSELLIIGRT